MMLHLSTTASKHDPDADKTEEQGRYYSRKKIVANEGLRRRVEFEEEMQAINNARDKCHAALVAGGKTTLKS